MFLPHPSSCPISPPTAGAYYDEAAAPAQRSPCLACGGLYWGHGTPNMKLGGLLRLGVRLGHATGLDSGSTLDYVIATRLRASGWSAVLSTGIAGTPSDGAVSACASATWKRCCAGPWRFGRRRKRGRIMDIAAGHGRYVLKLWKATGRIRNRFSCATTAPERRGRQQADRSKKAWGTWLL